MKHRSQISPQSFSDILFLVVMSRLYCLGGEIFSNFPPLQVILEGCLRGNFPSLADDSFW